RDRTVTGVQTCALPISLVQHGPRCPLLVVNPESRDSKAPVERPGLFLFLPWTSKCRCASRRLRQRLAQSRRSLSSHRRSVWPREIGRASCRERVAAWGG